MKAVKLSNLKVGDLFIHKGTMYEVIQRVNGLLVVDI